MSGGDCIGLKLAARRVGALARVLKQKGEKRTIGDTLAAGEEIRKIIQQGRRPQAEIVASVAKKLKLTNQEAEHFVTAMTEWSKKHNNGKLPTERAAPRPNEKRDWSKRDKENPLNDYLPKLKDLFEYKGIDCVNIEMIIPAPVVDAVWPGKSRGLDWVIYSQRARDKKTGEAIKEPDGSDKTTVGVYSYHPHLGGTVSKAEEALGGVDKAQEMSVKAIMDMTVEEVMLEPEGMVEALRHNAQQAMGPEASMSFTPISRIKSRTEEEIVAETGAKFKISLDAAAARELARKVALARHARRA